MFNIHMILDSHKYRYTNCDLTHLYSQPQKTKVPRPPCHTHQTHGFEDFVDHRLLAVKGVC